MQSIAGLPETAGIKITILGDILFGYLQIENHAIKSTTGMYYLLAGAARYGGWDDTVTQMIQQE